MLLPNFISSLSVSNTDEAYIVAKTESGSIVGSVYFNDPDGGEGLSQGQGTIAIWGDDNQTSEIDGAISGENITFDLVVADSLFNLYDDIGLFTVQYASNGFIAQPFGTAVFQCVGSSSSSTSGCTDANACNYDAQATEDDSSCTYAAENYNCSGECLIDSDSDGVCDANEISGCTDSTATNYDSSATEDDGSCVFIQIIEGCTDSLASNYNDQANSNDGTCSYEVLGCTNPIASNYNVFATEDDGSCIFGDDPLIYITSPVNGGSYSDTEIEISFEVLNFLIGIPPNTPGHIKYSIDGGPLVSIFTNSYVTFETIDAVYGEHTIEFTIYDNNQGNISPWVPAISSIVTFTYGPPGCTDSLAGNYNPIAATDDGSCIPNIDFDFSFDGNTGSNHTIVLTDLIEPFYVEGLLAQAGDSLGVFYQAFDGSYHCAGSTEWNGGDSIATISAWGDDQTTPEQDGFISGQEFIWAIQFAETGHSLFIDAIYQQQGTSTYATNSISAVTSFESINFNEIMGCTNPEYVEYNPFASIDNGTCSVEKIFGCMDDQYLEHWDYNIEDFTISNPTIVANTDDGSCITFIIEGCKDSLYIDYCDICNVSTPDQCISPVIEGCTDSIAENYVAVANSDDGSCEYNICVEFELFNFDVEFLSSLDAIVLSFDFLNLSNVVMNIPEFQLQLSSSTYFQLGDIIYGGGEIYPMDTVSISSIILNDLSQIPSYVLLSGQLNLEAVGFGINENINIDCSFNIMQEYLSTDHIGCTDVTAFNYDSQATIDDGSCVEHLDISVVVNNALCDGEYGSAIAYVTGGFPPYSTYSVYVGHTNSGVALSSIEFNDEGVAYLEGLEEGQYTIDISDENEVLSSYDFTITNPIESSLIAEVQPNGLLTSSYSGNAIFYQWLLDGISVDGANNNIHYPQATGMYQVYVEDDLGCGYYSESVELTFLGIQESFIEESLSIYPNPAFSELYFSLNHVRNVTTVSVLDILGQKHIEILVDSNQLGKEQSINISEFPRGLYFIEAHNGSHKVVKRFVKN